VIPGLTNVSPEIQGLLQSSESDGPNSIQQFCRPRTHIRGLGRNQFSERYVGLVHTALLRLICRLSVKNCVIEIYVHRGQLIGILGVIAFYKQAIKPRPVPHR